VRTKEVYLAFIVGMLALPPHLPAWEEDHTHPEITKHAVSEVSSLDAYLKEELRISQGIEGSLTGAGGKTFPILKWITDGSIDEDHPTTRSFRHFHDPTEPWESAGLWDSFLGMSNVLWSQKPDQDSSGNYSWPDTRDYYFNAFTAQSKVDRDNYLVETFSGLGHLMHLVEDVAVPLHTRNDIHVLRKDLEGWAANGDRVAQALAHSYVGPPPESLFDHWLSQYSSLAPCPVSALWDVDHYDGLTFPASILGLAEYSNANYFSWDTIDDYKFPLDHALPNQRYVEPENGALYLQHATSDGLLVHHLAQYNRVAWLQQGQELLDGKLTPYLLDRLCYADYASDLIPKAREYAGGMVDYFFRGSMDCFLLPVGGGTYEVIIRNMSDETMGGGTVTVGRLDPDNSLVTTSGNVGSISPHTSSAPIDITPLIRTDHRLEDLRKTFHVVYKGDLGSGSAEEHNAVVVYVGPLLALEERWSPSEGLVFRGSAGEIQGDLGTWRYMAYVDRGNVAPCDSRIEISNGVLTVYECHHRDCDPGCHGQGAYRIWLDEFDHSQERMPLEAFEWTCSPATGDLGEGGYSKCYLGLRDGGLREDNPPSLNLNDDYLCLRGLGGGGSLYLGETLLNNSVVAETNSSTMSLSGIRLSPTASPDSYPPEGVTTATETWRGITGTYRPGPVYDPFTGYHEGEVRVPGDFGTWVFYIRGIQSSLEPCDTRVEIANGVATIHECHHKKCDLFGCTSTGAWRFYMPEPYGDLTKTPLSAILWDGSVQGDLGEGYTTSAVGLKNGGLTELGGISNETIPLAPPDKLKVIADTFAPLAFRFGLYSDAEGEPETYATTTQLQNISLGMFSVEEEEAGRIAARLESVPAEPTQGAPGPLSVAPDILEEAQQLERESMATHDLVDYSEF